MLPPIIIEHIKKREEEERAPPAAALHPASGSAAPRLLARSPKSDEPERGVVIIDIT